MTVPITDSPSSLRDAWTALRECEPGIGLSEAASELEVSEGELVAARCGEGVRRIQPGVERFLPRLEELGPLTAVTRNPLFDHRKTGVYENVYVHSHVSSVAGPAIDLRIFPGRWAHGFAVDDATGIRPGLHFFDSHGAPVHEIAPGEGSDREAYEALVESLLHPSQEPGIEVEPPGAPSPSRPDDEVDVAALERDWTELRDTHDFLGMLRDHEVSRTQALRLASDELARPAEPDAVRRILQGASGKGIEIMIFVRSPGTIQIHHGPVERLVEGSSGPGVQDPGFELRVREDGIAGAWVVRKFVETGRVTSLEIYDARDTLCAHFFGCRKEGEPEDPAWRELVEGTGISQAPGPRAPDPTHGSEGPS